MKQKHMLQQKGFTLVEVIMAMGLMAMIGVTAALIANSLSKQQELMFGAQAAGTIRSILKQNLSSINNNGDYRCNTVLPALIGYQLPDIAEGTNAGRAPQRMIWDRNSNISTDAFSSHLQSNGSGSFENVFLDKYRIQEVYADNFTLINRNVAYVVPAPGPFNVGGLSMQPVRYLYSAQLHVKVNYGRYLQALNQIGNNSGNMSNDAYLPIKPLLIYIETDGNRNAINCTTKTFINSGHQTEMCKYLSSDFILVYDNNNGANSAQCYIPYYIPPCDIDNTVTPTAFRNCMNNYKIGLTRMNPTGYRPLSELFCNAANRGVHMGIPDCVQL